MLCKKCLYPIQLNLSEFYLVLGTPRIGNNTLEVAEFQLVANTKPVFEAKYYCPKCKKSLSNEEIVMYCDTCGDPKPPEKLFKVEGLSGIYCGDDLKVVLDNLEEMIEKDYKVINVKDVLHTCCFVPREG